MHCEVLSLAACSNLQVTRMLARDVGNAYDVLGVKPDLDPSLLKKK